MRTFQWYKTVGGVRTPTRRMCVEFLTRELYNELLVPGTVGTSSDVRGSFEDILNRGFTEVAWVPFKGGKILEQVLRTGQLPKVDKLLELVQQL